MKFQLMVEVIAIMEQLQEKLYQWPQILLQVLLLPLALGQKIQEDFIRQ
jgi:membrane protein required for beta-lactamase induction